MSTRTPTLAAFALAAGEGNPQQLPNFFDAVIYSPHLMQAFCWLLVLFL
jgi:hypothetical protein